MDVVSQRDDDEDEKAQNNPTKVGNKLRPVSSPAPPPVLSPPSPDVSSPYLKHTAQQPRPPAQNLDPSYPQPPVPPQTTTQELEPPDNDVDAEGTKTPLVSLANYTPTARKPPITANSSLEMDKVFEDGDNPNPPVLEISSFYSAATMMITLGYVCVYVLYAIWNPDFISVPQRPAGLNDSYPFECFVTDGVVVTDANYTKSFSDYQTECDHTLAVQQRIFHVYGWIIKPIGALSLGLSFALKPRRTDPAHTHW